MFDEMPVDQFYQFLAARSTTTPANSCIPFSLHHHHPAFPPALDPSPYSHQGFISTLPPITHLLNNPPLHPQLKNEDRDEAAGVTSELDLIHHSNWSHHEVLALLRIRSSLDNSNWFPDFIWETVSRMLGELGFERSAQNCKAKFEQETKSFNTTINANNCTTKNNNIISSIQNYRLFGELEDLCNNHHRPPQSAHDQSPSRQLDGDHVEEEGEEEENAVIRKRKRHNKFEMFKGFCENIVNNMMAQQEELHCKILQDMVDKEEEKIAREEAWRKKELERIQMEMEVRAHELAIVRDRQAKILSFLNNLNCSSTSFSLEPNALIEVIDNLLKVQKCTSSSTTSSLDLTQGSIFSAQPTSSSTTHDENPYFSTTHLNCPMNVPTTSISQSHNENNLFNLPCVDPGEKSSGSTDSTEAADYKPNTENNTKDEIAGRRWPRDEVLALINIRCNHESNDHQISSIITKGIPLWERISQKMTEMGFKRNARRCKEKWENINKYFRKTKDLKRKRSIDSRTCPYFNQLSHLYGQTQDQGTLLLGTSDPQVVSRLPLD